MERSYADPRVRDAIFGVLDRTWPGIADRIRLAATLGHDWTAISTPFADLEGDRAVAHVGVIAIPMVIDGAEAVVAGVHGVCVDPERRGQGRLRPVLEAALRHVDERHDTALLWTDKPAMYERFGFRQVREHRFVIDRPVRRGPDLRRLGNDDAALVNRILRTRRPVSRVVASRDPGWLFVIDEVLASRGLGRLWYAEDHDAILAACEIDGVVHALDVAAAGEVPLGELLARLPLDGPVHAWFTTEGRPEPGVFDGDQLMVRGPLPIEGRPFAISPLAHC